MQDGWGNTIDRGSYFVTGMFYGVVDGRTYTILKQKSPDLLYSHLARSIKIPIEEEESCNNLYKMSLEVYEAIYNSMPIDLKLHHRVAIEEDEC